MNKLLILSAQAQQYAALVRAAGLQNLQVSTVIDDHVDLKTAARQWVECNIILGDPPWVVDALSSARHLHWVQSTWAGIDSLCQHRLQQDYILTGAHGAFGPQISEYVMTYLIALERQVFTMRANQQQQKWQPLFYRPLCELCLGIIGLGSIGQHLACVAGRAGMRVIGLNRSGRACADVEKVYTAHTLAEFLAAPDYVVVTLPATEHTRHLINADVFSRMKSSAVLINVGRGSVVNEPDLITALQEGRIGGAVLDVFESEPLSADSPLWAMPNVYITPHNAGISFPQDIVATFVENYHRFSRGEPLLHQVDFARGY